MDRIATKTLAEIYLQQGHLQEAYDILRALSEKDPSDMEIQKRLKELSEKLGSLSPSSHPVNPPDEIKIRKLEKWLSNIRERKGR